MTSLGYPVSPSVPHSTRPGTGDVPLKLFVFSHSGRRVPKTSVVSAEEQGEGTRSVGARERTLYL